MIMIPVALAAGRFAGSWGRKAVFLIGFAALPIRGVLYTLSDNPYYLVGVQLMDGIGAGIGNFLVLHAGNQPRENSRAGRVSVPGVKREVERPGVETLRCSGGCLSHKSLRGLFERPVSLFTFGETLDYVVGDWNQEDGEQGCGQHSADHGRAHNAPGDGA
jgi:hypothetical protein